MSFISNLKSITDSRQAAGFWLLAAVCLTPLISSPLALIFGVVAASLGWLPGGLNTAALAKKLLAWAIVGLGFGIQLEQALATTGDGLALVVISIFATLAMGIGFSRLIGLDRTTGYLISAGTAICGGSAIAAVAPAIDADDQPISVALGTVFVLNSLALFLFPAIGHGLGLSQAEFGQWAAIAIHDTSSVVGAAGAYGDEALQIATTLKLTRALWIIPLVLLSSWLFRSQGSGKKLSFPLFIGFYCLAIGVAYLLPQLQPLYQLLFFASKRLMVLCLFLIGSGITLQRLREAGPAPLTLGVGLWLVISVGSLTWILAG